MTKRQDPVRRTLLNRFPVRCVPLGTVQDLDEPQVEIKVRDNGPLKVTGPVRLVDVDGRAWDIPADRPIALCRCGHSKAKPFCDRSHREEGFESCERAPV